MDAPLLLESPERWLRRAAAALAAHDAKRKAKAVEQATRWNKKNPDRLGWHSNNTYRRAKGLPLLTFDEYMLARLRRAAAREAREEKTPSKPATPLMSNPNRMRWHRMNYRLRRAGKEEVSFEEYERRRAESQSVRAVGRKVLAEREERYQRLKERLKKEPSYNEYRMSRLGVLTPEEMRVNAMEYRSTTEHYWDKITRQVEGSPTHPGGSGTGGWISLGAGGFRKRARGTF